MLRCSIILSSDCRPTGTTDLGKFKILHFPKKFQLFSFYFQVVQLHKYIYIGIKYQITNSYTVVYKPQLYTNKFRYEMIFFNFHWLLRNSRHSKQDKIEMLNFENYWLTDWGFHNFVNLILMALCAYVVGQFPLFLAETYHVRSKNLKVIYLPLGTKSDDPRIVNRWKENEFGGRRVSSITNSDEFKIISLNVPRLYLCMLNSNNKHSDTH